MAKPVRVTISHDLGRETARARIDAGIDRVLNSMAGGMLSFDRAWAGDTMTFGAKAMGQSVDGSVVVHESTVDIEVRLPMLLAGMAEQIAGRIRTDAPKLLTKN